MRNITVELLQIATVLVTMLFVIGPFMSKQGTQMWINYIGVYGIIT